MFAFTTHVLAAALVSIILAVIARPLYLNAEIFSSGLATAGDREPKIEPIRLLLLTAHPDDECMFFAPTVLALTTHDIATLVHRPEVFSLCLSAGNADGLGEIRRRELNKSLDVLGIREGNRWIEDRPDLQDNFTMRWDPQVIADVVKPYVLEHRITTILTFDHQGISGHPNHISLPHGAARLIDSMASEPKNHLVPRLFTLVSVPIVPKYTGPVAPLFRKTINALGECKSRLKRRLNFGTTAPLQRTSAENLQLSPITSDECDMINRNKPMFVSGVMEYVTTLRAMSQHSSQLVWFRWLYVAFSRYMWVNDLVEIVLPACRESVPYC